MTLTYELDVDGVRMNHCANHIKSHLFKSYCVRDTR